MELDFLIDTCCLNETLLEGISDRFLRISVSFSYSSDFTRHFLAGWHAPLFNCNFQLISRNSKNLSKNWISSSENSRKFWKILETSNFVKKYLFQPVNYFLVEISQKIKFHQVKILESSGNLQRTWILSKNIYFSQSIIFSSKSLKKSNFIKSKF